MDRGSFTNDMPGRLVDISGGYTAFIPDPLPPRLQFGLATIWWLSEADRAVSWLAGIGQTLPNPHLLIGPFLRREAVLSSRIEGTTATFRQLVLFEASPASGSSDVREVHNYVTALEYGLHRLPELPVSLRLIRELHERLMAGVRGQERNPGQFRRMQNAIRGGGPSGTIRYVPPPLAEMTQALHDLERFIAGPSDLPPLVQLALIHYQFEAIHPFMDGNGRIGRLLITLLLCERNLLPQPLLYLSAYFERNRDQYMDHLLHVSQSGDWSGWITFFLQGVAEQSRDAIQRSQRLLALWQEHRRRIQATRASAAVLRVVDDLYISPVTTLGRVRELLGVTSRAAQFSIERLQEAGILRETTGRPRNRIYAASEIIEILEA